MRRAATTLSLLLAVIGAFGICAGPSAASTTPTSAVTPLAPIKHVVIVFQENHSFDETLGALCLSLTSPSGGPRCDARARGRLPDGSTIALRTEPDVVPNIEHDGLGQIGAINGGLMNNFPAIPGCQAPAYRCYMRFLPDQIPSLSALARKFVISDRTFELSRVPSWHAHMEIASATLDGFAKNPGENPFPGRSNNNGLGWGCNSQKDAWWWSTALKKVIAVPTCIPKRDGSGPYRRSPVRWVPTIMDRLQGAGISWKIYSGHNPVSYIWGICPSFADCIYNRAERTHSVDNDAFFIDAAAGRLPAVSFLIPAADQSQHNGESMLEGDNWISRVVTAAGHSSQWKSTAIFITYDDCGCFYDHVPPPNGWGIRVPMVIVSPYARWEYTDHTNASFASMLRFIEHLFDLPALNDRDRAAYDYANSFNFARNPRPAPMLTTTPIPAAERAWLEAHPGNPDDPT
jgi:phospholipase C